MRVKDPNWHNNQPTDHADQLHFQFVLFSGVAWAQSAGRTGSVCDRHW